MTAVVLVHKEAMVGDQDVSAEREDAYRDTPDEQEFEQDFEQLVFKQEEERANKRRKAHLLPGETMHLEVDPYMSLATQYQSAERDPVMDDTLRPMHASLRTGHVMPYGPNSYAAHAVTSAQGVAAAALEAGKSERTAYEKAQDAAAKVVVKDAAEDGKSPAFSRTIKAAAYQAKMSAIKAMEQGQSAAAAKLAAQRAATSMVKDDRAVELTVPVPNTLRRLLGNVDVLWQ